jgi:hypothetical protein
MWRFLSGSADRAADERRHDYARLFDDDDNKRCEMCMSSKREILEEQSSDWLKVSQHLALLRQRGIVLAERVGNEMHYSLADARILEACHITREILLQQLAQQGTLATMLAGTRES